MLIIENLAQLSFDLSNHFNILKNKTKQNKSLLAPGEKEKKDYSWSDPKVGI